MFPQFWSAKSTRIIIFTITSYWWPRNEVELFWLWQKNGGHFTRFKSKNLRWPTTITAKPKTSRQKQNTPRQNRKPHGKNKIPHGKTKNLTAKTKYLTAKPKTSRQKQNTSRQNQKPHGKTKYFTAKTKYRYLTAKANTHGKTKLFCFCCEVFCFCREVFCFALMFLFLPWSFWFCRDSYGPP